MPEQYDDDRLGRIIRADLHQRASQAPDRLSRPVTSGRWSRRSGLLSVVAASAVLVVVVGIPLAGQVLDSTPTSGSGDPPASDRAAPPAHIDGWRVESYGGIQVRVPPNWGWGGAWFHDPTTGGKAMDCGAAPFVVPGDPDYETVPQDAPYVGRPMAMTDVCALVGQGDAPEPPDPQADSVWIGAAVPPGREDLGNGYVRETVQITAPTQFGNGTVSVTSDDPALREQILATAEAVEVDDNDCRADATWADFPAGRLEDGKPTSLSVCLYETYRGETTLIWSDRRPADAAREYIDQLSATSATYDPDRLCTKQPDGQWLAIGVAHADGTAAWSAVTMGNCAQILWQYRAVGDPESLAAAPVAPSTVAPWATPAVRAYVVGPVGWSEYGGEDGVFRGMLG